MKWVYFDLGLLIYFALTFNWFPHVSNEYLIFISFFSSIMIKCIFNLLYAKEIPNHPGSSAEKSCLCSHILSKNEIWKIKFDIDNGRLLETNISLKKLMEGLRIDYNSEKALEAEEINLFEKLLQKIILQEKFISNINFARSKSAKKSSFEENHSLEEILESFKSLNNSESLLNNFIEIGKIKNEIEEVTEVFIRQTQKNSSHYEIIFLSPQIEKNLYPSNIDIIQERKKLAKITDEIANIILTISNVCNYSKNSVLKQNEIGLNTGNRSKFEIGMSQASRSGEFPKAHKFGGFDHLKSIKYIKSLIGLLLHQIENLKFLNNREFNFSFQSASMTEIELIPALDFCLEIFQIRQKYDFNKNNLKIISQYECKKGTSIKINCKMLKKILITLLSNAYQFSVSGQIILGVTQIEEEKKLRISVSDTGCAISEAEKKKLVNSNESGLGLSIANQFIKQIGSNLEFVSNKNEGSKFWFDLEYLECSLFDLTCSLPSVQNEIYSKDTCVQNDLILSKSDRQFIRPFTKFYKGPSLNSSLSSFTKDNLQKIRIDTKNTSSHFMNQKKHINSEILCNNRKISSKFQNSESSLVMKKTSSNILFIDFQNDKEVAEDHILKYINCKKNNKKPECVFKSSKLNRTYILESADEISKNPYSNNSRQKFSSESIESNIEEISYSNINPDNQPQLKSVLNIIVCDDEKTILRATSNIIKKVAQSKNIDVNIITCSNGIECIKTVYEAYIKKQYIDFLFIEESMPFIRGSLVTYLLKTITKEQQINDIIIYVVTAYQDEYNLGLIKSRDCDGVIEKPITATVLRGLLK